MYPRVYPQNIAGSHFLPRSRAKDLLHDCQSVSTPLFSVGPILQPISSGQPGEPCPVSTDPYHMVPHKTPSQSIPNFQTKETPPICSRSCPKENTDIITPPISPPGSSAFGKEQDRTSTIQYRDYGLDTERMPEGNKISAFSRSEIPFQELHRGQPLHCSSTSSGVSSRGANFNCSNSDAQPESACLSMVPTWAQASLSTIINEEGSIRQAPGFVEENFPSMLRCLQCRVEFLDKNEQRAHLWDKHPPKIGWSRQTCLWQGCNLSKKFETHRSWLQHVHNVHQKRYRCKFRGCALTKPFGNKSMLNRHYNSKHGERKPCTKAGCQAHKPNLCRTDKLREHEAKWHGPLDCKVPNCPRKRKNGVNHGFTRQLDLIEHVRVKHPCWNCGNGYSSS